MCSLSYSTNFPKFSIWKFTVPVHYEKVIHISDIFVWIMQNKMNNHSSHPFKRELVQLCPPWSWFAPGSAFQTLLFPKWQTSWLFCLLPFLLLLKYLARFSFPTKLSVHSFFISTPVSWEDELREGKTDKKVVSPLFLQSLPSYSKRCLLKSRYTARHGVSL